MGLSEPFGLLIADFRTRRSEIWNLHFELPGKAGAPMFRLVLTSVLTVLQLYVLWRAVPLWEHRGWRFGFAAVAVVLWGMVVAFWYGRLGHGNLGHALRAVSLSWMGILFLLAVALLAADLLTGFGWLFSPQVTLIRRLGLAAGVLMSLTAFIQAARPPVIERHEVILPGLPAALDGTKVVAMSDLHLSPRDAGRWLEARVRQVQGEKPDAILLLGDITEDHWDEITPVSQGLSGLQAPLGTWAVIGNHESYGNVRINTSVMERAGVRVVRNAAIELRPGLVLAGVDDLSAATREQAVRELDRTLTGRPAGATVLMSHAPVAADHVAARGVALMLSGHTHRGQIWPFNYLVATRFPLIDGRYQVDGLTAIVCRGTAWWGPPMRLWYRGAILSLTLRAGP